MQDPSPSQQRADVDNQGNIVVQIPGSDNRATIASATALFEKVRNAFRPAIHGGAACHPAALQD